MEFMIDGRFSEGEWEQLLGLLRRFAESDLDQHDAWRLDTVYGQVFIRISREPGPGEPATAFRPVGASREWLPGGPPE
jgi:hypothetical protein